MRRSLPMIGLVLMGSLACISRGSAAEPGTQPQRTPAAGPRVLFEESFAGAATGWEAKGQAVLADVGRHPGRKSIALKQDKKEDAASYWLSPAIANPGKPVCVSFWAVPDYVSCPDFTYAGIVSLIGYDKDGKEIGPGDEFLAATWDDTRKEDMWGKSLPEGRVWRYYSQTFRPRGASFRVRFGWRQPLAQGDCYLTDLQVTESDGAAREAAPTAAGEPANLVLELSTPVGGNLFYREIPPQFELLFYSRDQQPVRLPADGTIVWEITDFERFFIARGETDVAGFAPLANQDFLRSAAGATRKENVHRKLVVEDPRARETGRLFFFEAKLVSGGTVVAADTTAYGVVDPRTIDPQDYAKCIFSMEKGHGVPFKPTISQGRVESLAAKMGVHSSHGNEGGWSTAQPAYPGPIDFGKYPFPPIAGDYRMTFNPNYEQVCRGGWATEQNLKRIPVGAVVDDPLNPGKKTFDIDAHVAYTLAYIRQYRDKIVRVVPSGLERPIDARTVELHKKSYTAIKKEFPDIDVGLMIYGLEDAIGPDHVFFKEKLHDYCDFIDNHYYCTSPDFRGWKSIQAACKDMPRKPRYLVTTEAFKLGAGDQLSRSVDEMLFHLDSMANGMRNIMYFNCTCRPGPFPQPVLRAPDSDSFFYMQYVDRPRVSKEIPDGPEWRGGSHEDSGRGGSLLPLLPAMTYYNLVQNFELAEFRETLTPTPESIAHVFDRADGTVLALWLRNPVAAQTLAIDTSVPCTVQDIFGRTQTLTPVDGRVLVSVEEKPLTMVFSGKLAAVKIEPIVGGLSAPTLPKGGKGELLVTLPGVFPSPREVAIACTVDGTWPEVKEHTIKVGPGEKGAATLPMAIDAGRAVGSYTLSARLTADGKVFGWLRNVFHISEELGLEVESVPLRVKQDPAVKVTVRNYGGRPHAGMIRFEDRWFAAGLRPETQQQPYRVPAGGTAEVVFPIPRGPVNLTTAFTIRVDLEDESGIRTSREETVSFLATERVPGPISVDGDLADWKLDTLVPVPFGRELGNYGKKRTGDTDTSGVFYTRWDDDNLYFAAILRDDKAVVLANTVDIWEGDSFMFGLYPWGVEPDEALHAGSYREHLGPCKDGVARIFRLGAASGGPTELQDAAIATKRTADGWAYEWSYPKAMLHPLDLRPGGRYRLSLVYFDKDDPARGRASGGLMFGGFNTNVKVDVLKWPEFLLVK